MNCSKKTFAKMSIFPMKKKHRGASPEPVVVQLFKMLLPRKQTLGNFPRGFLPWEGHHVANLHAQVHENG
jgi:hypothetical protein